MPAPCYETTDSALQRAKAEKWQAELSARTMQKSARQDMTRVQTELDELQRKDERALPYEFEEIEEIYRIISQPGFTAKALRTAAVLLLLVLLVRAWSMRGPEGVAGCALMPIVCTMEATLDVMDTVP